MAGLVTQLQLIQQGQQILSSATRASAQFVNTANSTLADLASLEAQLPSAGLDQNTLTEIATLKADTIATIRQQIASIDAALANA